MQDFSFKKIYLKMLPAEYKPFCSGLKCDKEWSYILFALIRYLHLLHLYVFQFKKKKLTYL